MIIQTKDTSEVLCRDIRLRKTYRMAYRMAHRGTHKNDLLMHTCSYLSSGARFMHSVKKSSLKGSGPYIGSRSTYRVLISISCNKNDGK